MIRTVQIRLSPRQAADEYTYIPVIAKRINVDENDITTVRVIKKSIDARKTQIIINLQVEVYINEEFVEKKIEFDFKDVKDAKEVIIVGAGPAGLFAAIQLIQQGIKPIIIERGESIENRKRDIANIYKEGKINKNSNYCFGEGGAGTFSDGKLFTRSKKKGNVASILELFVYHGADSNILYEAHPHIGTDKLPRIIKNIRETILKYGGEVLFNTKVVSFQIEDNQIKGVTCDNGKKFISANVILATGHSARDIYYYFNDNNIKLEKKSFAMGVRIEHPQNIVDKFQYQCERGRGEFLPPAEYNLICQNQKRGVYSFCMCPGGVIVPAGTDEGEMVVNGMSNNRRNSKFANAGFVVEIRDEDLHKYKKHGVLAALEFQKDLEKLASKHALGLKAPAQRLLDFCQGSRSKSLPDTSYIPGIVSSEMHEWLPKHIASRLKGAFIYFSKKMYGFMNLDAIMIGVESRTSSPLRIPRDKETLEHVEVKGLYPCGEGAGYAGGIVSSAIDGQRCAMKIT